MTLRAVRIIAACPVIAYPQAEGIAPFAKTIAAAHLRDSQIEIPMVMPMVASRFPAQEVYEAAASDIRAHLRAGRDVAVLCEGDSLLYGSFMYLLERLRDVPVEIVPGVSSVFAVSAAAAYPLVSRNETLSLVSGVLDDAALKARFDTADALAIFKVGRHFNRLKTLITQLGLLENATYVERASLENQVVLPLKDVAYQADPAEKSDSKISDSKTPNSQMAGSQTHETRNAPYFSMIVVRKGPLS